MLLEEFHIAARHVAVGAIYSQRALEQLISGGNILDMQCYGGHEAAMAAGTTTSQRESEQKETKVDLHCDARPEIGRMQPVTKQHKHRKNTTTIPPGELRQQMHSKHTHQIDHVAVFCSQRALEHGLRSSMVSLFPQQKLRVVAQDIRVCCGKAWARARSE